MRGKIPLSNCGGEGIRQEFTFTLSPSLRSLDGSHTECTYVLGFGRKDISIEDYIFHFEKHVLMCYFVKRRNNVSPELASLASWQFVETLPLAERDLEVPVGVRRVCIKHFYGAPRESNENSAHSSPPPFRATKS